MIRGADSNNTNRRLLLLAALLALVLGVAIALPHSGAQAGSAVLLAMPGVRGLSSVGGRRRRAEGRRPRG